jgi:CHAD domain-containing protein
VPTSADEPGSNITELLRQRIRGVFRHLPKGLGGDEEAIHQMRVAGRRLRVALPILCRRPHGRRVRRALRVLRALTRTAGQSRDLDVSLDLLTERLRLLEAPTREQTLLRARLRAARTRSRSRMAEALMDLEIARLRHDLRVILARTADAVFAVKVRLRAVRDEQGEALVEGFQALSERFDPVALHALRRRARRLRYAAEVGDAVRGGEPSEAPALWKTLQERIGTLHDHHVLARWLHAQVAGAEKRGQTAFADAARAQGAWAEATAEGLHAQLLEARPLEIATKALAAMGRARTAA